MTQQILLSQLVSFDDWTLLEFAKSNLANFLKAFSDVGIINKAQKAPEIFDAVNQVVDWELYELGK